MNTFKTIATFSYPAQAVVVKSKLESEGITVFLKDEFTVATDPFATNAIGGVKMQVYKEDQIRALGIIEQHNPDLIKHNTSYIVCPNCGKRRSREHSDINSATTWRQRWRAVFYSVFPFFIEHNYHCTHCDHNFNVDE